MMDDKTKALLDALREIKEFGRNNPGLGYSASKMAERALINFGTEVKKTDNNH